MARPKTQLKFNPDTMTVSDVKLAARTLRGLMETYTRLAAELEAGTVTEAGMENWLACEVAQIADAYEVA